MFYFFDEQKSTTVSNPVGLHSESLAHSQQPVLAALSAQDVLFPVPFLTSLESLSQWPLFHEASFQISTIS